MLNRLVLAVAVFVGGAFALMVLPANGMIIAMAPFCLSAIFSLLALCTLAVLESIAQSRRQAQEAATKLYEMMDRRMSDLARMQAAPALTVQPTAIAPSRPAVATPVRPPQPGPEASRPMPRLTENDRDGGWTPRVE